MKRIIRRQNFEKYDAVLSSDLHLREDTPICRGQQEYQEAQIQKMSFISDLCQKHQCPFLHAGDLFDHWKPSPWLISLALEYLPDEIITVAGQHDMQNHSLDLSRTGLETMRRTGRLMILDHDHRYVLLQNGRIAVVGYSFGELNPQIPEEVKKIDKKILLWHHLICSDSCSQPWPNAGADVADRIFQNFSDYNLIIAGDNHQQFFVVQNQHKKALVNPGSIMRMTADQAEFEPAVFGWRASDNSITRIPLPINKDVVSREHLDKENKESRDARMDAYILRSQKSFESKLSFTKNLENHFKANKESEGVEQLVWKAVEKEGDENKI